VPAGRNDDLSPLIAIHTALDHPSTETWSDDPPKAGVADEREPPADLICARRLPSSRRVLATCEVLRGLAYSAARPGDDDDLVFDSGHEVLLS